MQKNLNIAVVGATGLVGRTMLNVLAQYDIPVEKIVPFASERSAEKLVDFRENEYKIQVLTPENVKKFGPFDFALFSAGGSVSLKYAPIFAESGCIVIDNSSAWRMHPDSPLVVPEVNPQALFYSCNKIIANPNCSTIQMVLPLKALHDKFGLKRVVVSTYQSIAGAGQKGVDKLMHEIDCKRDDKVSALPIAFNTIFHTIPADSEFSEEEMKMINETRKILEIPELPITATCVRLPILGGHGESINLELNNEFTLKEVIDTLSDFPGIVVQNGHLDGEYPTVQACEGTDLVYVGRIRIDKSVKNGLHLWVVSDNIRKGAASNAVQILKTMIENC